VEEGSLQRIPQFVMHEEEGRGRGSGAKAIECWKLEEDASGGWNIPVPPINYW
jgi:hypothetical protein